MNLDFKKVAILGLKVLAAVASGVAVFVGISGEFRKKKKVVPASPAPPESEKTVEKGLEERVVEDEESTSTKIVGGLRAATNICAASMDVFRSLADVTSSVNRLFNSNDPRNPRLVGGYQVPGYIPGNYPWNQPEYVGSPYNTPIYQGKDARNDDVFWIHRPNGIIEVW